MPYDRYRETENLIWLCIVVMVCALSGGVRNGHAGEGSPETVVVVGDNFIMTKSDIDRFAAFVKSKNLKWPEDTVLKAALKYELLSREYQKTMGGQPLTSSSTQDDDIAIKIQQGKQYLQSILESQQISDAVIESYYRTNPEKYGVGKGSEGNAGLIPLDASLKKEIRFMVIEKKRERITQEVVENLMTKYHIKIVDKG